MRRNWKRILSLLLTVAMVFTMNTSVFATEPTATATGDETTVEAAETTESTAAETVEETKETNSEATSETTEAPKTEETATTEEVAAEAVPAETTATPVEETPAVEETATVAEETTEAAPVEGTVVAETAEVVEEAEEVAEAKGTVVETKAVDLTNWNFKLSGNDLEPGAEKDYVAFEVDGVSGISFNKATGNDAIIITPPDEGNKKIIISSNVAVKVSLNGAKKVNYVKISGNHIDISGNSTDGTIVRNTGNITTAVDGFKGADVEGVYIFAEPTKVAEMSDGLFAISENGLYYYGEGNLTEWKAPDTDVKVDGTDNHKITANAGKSAEMLVSGDNAVYKMTVSAPKAIEKVYVSVDKVSYNKVTVSAESVGNFNYMVAYKAEGKDDYAPVGKGIYDEEEIANGSIAVEGLAEFTNYTFAVSANGKKDDEKNIIYTDTAVKTEDQRIGEKTKDWKNTTDVEAYYLDGNKKMNLSVSQDGNIYRVTVSKNQSVVVKAKVEGLSINRIYLSSNNLTEVNADTLKALAVTLSGNKIKLGNSTVSAEGIGVGVTVQTSDKVIKEGTQIEYVAAVGAFPVDTWIYEPQDVGLSFDYEAITGTANTDVTILSKNDVTGSGVNNGDINKPFKISTSSTSLNAIVGVTEKNYIAETATGYAYLTIPAQTGAPTAIAAANITVSAGKITLTSTASANKYGITKISNNSYYEIYNDIKDDLKSVSLDNIALAFEDLEEGEDYYVVLLKNEKGKFANLNTTNITTGETINLTVTPKYFDNSQIIATKKISKNGFDYIVTDKDGETFDKTIINSDIRYFVNFGSTTVEISNNDVKAPDWEGTATISINEPSINTGATGVYNKNNVYNITTANGKVEVIKLATAKLTLTLSPNAKYYYSQYRDSFEEKITSKVNNDVVNDQKLIFSTSLNGAYVNKSFALTDDELTSVSAGKVFYVGAEREYEGDGDDEAVTLSADAIAVTVQKVPVMIRGEYNYFSKTGEALETSIAMYPHIAVTADVDDGVVLSNYPSESFISENGISANFANVDSTDLTGARQEYSLTGVKLKDSYSYNYELSNNTDNNTSAEGYGYFILPVYDVVFKELATNVKLQDVKVSSNAAIKAKEYTGNYRKTAIGENLDGSALSGRVEYDDYSKASWLGTSATKVLRGFYQGGNNVADSYGIWNYGYRDVTSERNEFYAAYDKFLGKEGSGKFGSLYIQDIPAVRYTGNKQITDLRTLSYYTGWYDDDAAGKKYYEKNYTKQQGKANREINLVIRTASRNTVSDSDGDYLSNVRLIEGRDYKVSYKNNINAFQNENNWSETDKKFKSKAPQIKITYIGDYKGRESDTVYFRINPMDVSQYYYAGLKTSAVKKNAKASSIKATVTRYEGVESIDAKKAKLTQNKDFRVNVYSATTSVNRASDGKVERVRYVKGDLIDPKSGKLSERGNYLVEVVGIGNYSGTFGGTSKVYDIDVDKLGNILTVFAYDPKSDINASKLKIELNGTVKKNTYDWNDDEKKRVVSGNVTFKKGGSTTTLKENIDYVVTGGSKFNSAGKHDYTVAAIPDPFATQTFYGAKSQKYTVNGVKLKTVTPSNNGTLSFNGKVQYNTMTTALTVTDKNGATVSLNGDPNGFDVEFAGKDSDANTLKFVMPGTYKFKVVGFGKYFGSTKTYKVKIDKATIKASDISFHSYFTNSENKLDSATATQLSGNYSKLGAEPNGYFRYKLGDVFYQDSDGWSSYEYGSDDNLFPALLTYKYTKNKAAGTGKLTVKAVSKYAKLDSKITKDFTINPQDLKESGTMYLNYVKDADTDGKKLSKSKMLQVIGDDKEVLKYDKDYTIKTALSVSDNAKATVSGGQICTITIEGKGNYKGELKETSKVLLGDLSKAKVKLTSAKTIGSYTGDYYGDKVTVEVTVDGKTLSANQDYKLNFTKGKGLSTGTNKEGNATYAGSVTVIITGIDVDDAPNYDSKKGYYGNSGFAAKKKVKFTIKK